MYLTLRTARGAMFRDFDADLWKRGKVPQVDTATIGSLESFEVWEVAMFGPRERRILFGPYLGGG